MATSVPPLSLLGPDTNIIVEWMPNHFMPGKIKINWWDKSLEWEFIDHKGDTQRRKLEGRRFTVDRIGK